MSIDRTTSLPVEWEVTVEAMAETQPRVPYLDPLALPEEIQEELQPYFQRSLDNWGAVPRFLRMLGHCPPLVEMWMLFDVKVRQAYLEKDPEYVKVQQLVIIKTSILNHSINCTGHNVDLGRSVGLSWEQIDLLVDDGWKRSDLFTERERAAIRWAEAVTTHRAKEDEEAFDQMNRHFTERQIVELTFICGLWNCSGRFDALHLMVEPPDERIRFQPGSQPSKGDSHGA